MSNYMHSTDLPYGWSREEVIRKSGLSAGKADIYYHGPDGKKYRSKPQIARELGGSYDLSAFDFKSGKMMSHSTIIRRAKGKKTVAHDYSKGLRGDNNLSLPVRQTASIFKQPVTVIRSHPDSKVRHDLKHGSQDVSQPRQLFWERSLTNLKCCDIDEKVLESIDLPSKIQGIGPDLSTENLLQSIAAALHTGNHPVVGQSQPTSKFLKNPTIHINTGQPLVTPIYITEEDIKQQEAKVNQARTKLQEILVAIDKSNKLSAQAEIAKSFGQSLDGNSDTVESSSTKRPISDVAECGEENPPKQAKLDTSDDVLDVNGTSSEKLATSDPPSSSSGAAVDKDGDKDEAEVTVSSGVDSTPQDPVKQPEDPNPE